MRHLARKARVGVLVGRIAALAWMLCAAATASAHDAPALPSSCVCDTVELAAADGTARAAALPAGDADVLRAVYDVALGIVQLQARDVPPRAVLGETAGSIGFPLATPAALGAGGDLAFGGADLGGGAWFEVVLAGARASVRLPLTTGLAATGAGTVVAGEPIDGDGRFVAVAAIDAGQLPPPLAARPGVLRLGCRLAPPPDLDRFPPPARIVRLGGTLGSGGGRLRGVLEAAPPGGPGTGPVLVRVHARGETVATVVSGDPIDLRARRSAAAGAGGRVELRRVGEPADARWRMAVDLAGPLVGGTTGPLAITVVVGDLTARGTFRARARGRGAAAR